MSTVALRIVEPGVGTTVQDAGRHGCAHLGIPPAGAVDPTLAALVNRFVGNPPEAALLETVGGLVVEAEASVVVATSGHGAPHVLRPGDRVRVAPGGRRWHYLAVRGGLATPPVLGSRSHDTLSGLGVVPLGVGTSLPVGTAPRNDPVADVAPIPPVGATARIGPGPRLDWFGGDPLGALVDGPLVVTATSRVGVRLRGPSLVRIRHDELASEGLVRGAIQIPPDGDPIMMLADHPTTGGYPVVAVVHPDDVAVVAQHLDGTSVRLRM